MNFNEVVGKLYPQRAKGVEPEKIPWGNSNYTFQLKEDGDRRLLYFTKDKVHNSSRSKGADTGLPVTKTDNVPHIRDLNIPELEGTIIDCEFIHERGFQEGVRKIMGCLPDKAIQRQNEWGLIEVYAFDILYYKGESLIDKPLWKRLEYLEMVYDYYFKNIPFMKLYITIHGDKEEQMKKFEYVVANGGEGFVAKEINSTYRLSTEKCQSPLKNAWIKVKREFNGDFVVMGFDEPTKYFTGKEPTYFDDAGHAVTKYHYMGWIGGIKFGEYENGILVERGSCSGMDESLRAEISSNPNKYIGKVIEVDAMERIKKTKALRQPVFKRFRGDKLPTDCQYELQKG